MAHIIIGLLIFCLGVWGIVANWYAFVDVVMVLVPLVLLFGGMMALVSAISNFSKRRGGLRS